MLVTSLITAGAALVLPLLTPRAADSLPFAGALRHVGIGELRVGDGSEQLKVLLGSCVGIAFLWKKRGRCGLAHCLLPEAATPGCAPSARYVSQAVPSLLRLMGATDDDHADIVVVLAGGGMLLDGCSARFQIGQQNADAAHRHLRAYGLNVVDCRVGGTVGRTLTVNCATFDYQIDELPAQTRERRHAHA